MTIGDNIVIWSELLGSDLDIEILEYLETRVEKGYVTYGTMLATNNGRDAIQDLCEELADALFYSTQARLEATEDEAIESCTHIERALIAMLKVCLPKITDKSVLKIQEFPHAD